jgi:hypothetical protein
LGAGGLKEPGGGVVDHSDELADELADDLIIDLVEGSAYSPV